MTTHSSASAAQRLAFDDLAGQPVADQAGAVVLGRDGSSRLASSISSLERIPETAARSGERGGADDPDQGDGFDAVQRQRPRHLAVAVGAVDDVALRPNQLLSTPTRTAASSIAVAQAGQPLPLELA